jgi:5'-methylthioadenosine phosphorylase
VVSPSHILAGPGDIAEVAITSGDPARTEQLSKLLKDSKLVNSNRGFTTYTGYYGKTRLTLATHGIGGPSTAIVFEELHMLGAKTIIRFGTAGALVKSLKIGDFVVATGAASGKGSLHEYVDDGCLPAVPDVGLTYGLIQSCRRSGLRFSEGLVYSSDAFYTQNHDSLEKWVKRGVLAVEMECATLFTIGLLRGFKTGALLMMSNSLVNTAEADLAQAKKLEPFAAKGAKAIFDAVSGPSPG